MPPTSLRMRCYAKHAPRLAMEAIARLKARVPLDGISHLVVASCTGFVAPGIDQIIAERLGLEGVERSEERRVGNECVSTCRSRWSPSHEKKKPQHMTHHTNTFHTIQNKKNTQ